MSARRLLLLPVSRQSQRRATLATGVAAAAVVFAVGGTVAFAASHRSGPSTPPAAAPSSAEPGLTRPALFRTS